MSFQNYFNQETSANKRLEDGITIGCGSLSVPIAIGIPADEQVSAFCIYLRL